MTQIYIKKANNWRIFTHLNTHIIWAMINKLWLTWNEFVSWYSALSNDNNVFMLFFFFLCTCTLWLLRLERKLSACCATTMVRTCVSFHYLSVGNQSNSSNSRAHWHLCVCGTPILVLTFGHCILFIVIQGHQIWLYFVVFAILILLAYLFNFKQLSFVLFF